MELTDITSDDSAFYYGLSNKGCYVLSVTSGSNAEKAGFMRGDMITAVNGTSVSSKSDIETALKNSKVGDTVTFTVTRSGKTANLKLTLAEYSPSGSSSTGNSKHRISRHNHRVKVQIKVTATQSGTICSVNNSQQAF